MSDDDGTQAATPPQAAIADEGTAVKKRYFSGGFFIGLIACLGLLLAGAASALGYYAWLQLNKHFDQVGVDQQSIAHQIATIDEHVKLQGFKKQVQNDVAGMGQQLLELSRQVEQQAALQASMSEATQKTMAYVHRTDLGWGLKEVEHVLRMANHRLRIERDVAGAIAALSDGNARLHEFSGDDRLLPVRESISRQIGKLKNFPFPDWVGISLQLDHTIAGLKHNLIQDARPTRREEPKPSDSSPKQSAQKSGWGKFVGEIKDSLSNSVKITREKQKLRLFINQQEKQRAYEFLRLKLLGAKYAVASHDNESYRRELEAARAWLENIDSVNNSNDLLDELDELLQVDLEPELPDITEPGILLIEITERIENS